MNNKFGSNKWNYNNNKIEMTHKGIVAKLISIGNNFCIENNDKLYLKKDDINLMAIDLDCVQICFN